MDDKFTVVAGGEQKLLHFCHNNLPPASDYQIGTIVECNDCGRQFKCKMFGNPIWRRYRGPLWPIK
jgi:hypothetical protein